MCSFIGDDKVWHVDATTLTKAGLERELLNRSKDGVLQPFVLIEEIEKVTSPENINCLLQVMDTRGRIQRTNAKQGDVYGECKIVVWATCNDSEYLRKFADGAIWSRFSLRPICKRPDEALMRKILTRSVREMDGDENWVEPVIRFMWGELKSLREYKDDYNDPRLGRALLAGGDRLFDKGPEGFFADFLACCEGKETGEQK
jgi:MoxR-like ATPase